ncbi:uncharacterized protein MELLADRAFT_67697 [Melampsora larici-populina 98AG31]|uniref:Uncharacterized protein n=1 Tax=Melampsora larici-populina (strain 98AG31 / pathotype 3-4-7) TaxID=747676 RepID=F4S498_MELLP|nr:uncharacterized protein MELLADRAFT_67697 [Melampsora larici-populina 98AG31]EGG00595.1 hypothetical protein MELLADRAFT_67697 [Melampsora larici-populina 98AG31]
MADIGIRNPKIERLAERDTLRCYDDMYLDNPYAITGTKSFIYPMDGSNWEGRSSKWDDPSRTDIKEDKNETTKSTQSMRSTAWAQSRYEPHENTHASRATPQAYSHYVQSASHTQAGISQPQTDAQRGQGRYRGRNFIPNFRSNRGGRGRGGGARGGQNGSREGEGATTGSIQSDQTQRQ